MPTSIYSFGFRHYGGSPDLVPGDLVIDVRRVLPRNPFRDKKLRHLRGDHPEVIADICKTPGLEKSYLTLREKVRTHCGRVFLGCTGGHHRSVYLANRLGKDLKVPVTHLDYDKP